MMKPFGSDRVDDSFYKGFSISYIGSKVYSLLKQFWLILIIIQSLCIIVYGQTVPASPANWLYPDGSPEATRNVIMRSGTQSPDSFRIKWSTPYIKGDVQPLVGNLINNGRMHESYKWGTNEIAAVVGGKPIIIDARGFPHISKTPIPFIKGISVLFDTLSPGLGAISTNPLIMGFETIESENKKDSLSFAYIAGYDQANDTVALIKRMAVNLRNFKPNLFASIKPIYGRREGNEFFIYAVFNMSRPQVDTNTTPLLPPYLRGITSFNSGNLLYNFPVYDLGDDTLHRVYVAPEVNETQPSISLLGGIKSSLLLPVYPSTQLKTIINNQDTVNRTEADKPYLMGYDIGTSAITTDIFPFDLSGLTDSTRPLIRPYYLHLTDSDSRDSIFILVSEGYKGMDSSNGRPALHLFNSAGVPVTDIKKAGNLPFFGGEDHLWSIAVGDVDGNAVNTLPPYYPNNPGNEIIATFSSKDYAVAGNRLCVLRYKSGSSVPKVTPPNSYLNKFDTIATQKINGWVAAVNDLDGRPDGKSEILIVDGSTLRILRMRDYKDAKNRLDMPFDTVKSFTFPGLTIYSAIIADVEGDGLNDIIVTTHDSTFVLGMPIWDSLKIITPKVQKIPHESYCVGDTATIQWTNTNKTYGGVNIGFRVYRNGFPAEIIPMESNYPNLKETGEYKYVSGQQLLGYDGRFIIQAVDNPDIIIDSTAIIQFTRPDATLNSLSSTVYTAGDRIAWGGQTVCSDSVEAEYSYAGQNWQNVYKAKVNNDGSYNFNFIVPCPLIYGCTSPDIDDNIFIRTISSRLGFRDTSDIASIKVKPQQVLLNIKASDELATGYTFTWDKDRFENFCDTISVSYSVDGGQSFKLIKRIAADENKFQWQVRTDFPDNIVLRFCCENSCVRTDTLLNNYKPKFINIVAPNPFNPQTEQLEIAYSVPKEANVTIKIYDENNRVAVELVSSQPRLAGVAYSEFWDGKLGNGTYAANGMYYLSLEMSGGEKEVYPIFVKK